MVNREAVDLVIMGTHGRQNLGRWFLGSVTERLLRKLPVPVLTVAHVDTQKRVGPASVKHILYATDLDGAEPDLNYAVELARGAGAELAVLHVADSMDRRLWRPALLARLEGERAKLVRQLKLRVDDLVARTRQEHAQINKCLRRQSVRRKWNNRSIGTRFWRQFTSLKGPHQHRNGVCVDSSSAAHGVIW